MNSPTLYIPRKIYLKLMHWVDKSDFEVSWIGTLTYNKETNQFVVQEIFLLEQVNEKAETEIKAADLCDLLYDTRNEVGDLRWWGHSHVKMGVFWSGTDRKTMKELSQDGWFLSTVFNQKREMKTAFTQGGEMPLMVDDIPTYIYDPVSKEEKEEWDDLYKKNVKNKTYSSTYPSFTFGNYPGQYTGAPMYTPEEYKLLSSAVSGSISQKAFTEGWKKCGGKLLPDWVKKSESSLKIIEEILEEEKNYTKKQDGYTKFISQYENYTDDDDDVDVKGIVSRKSSYGDNLILEQIKRNKNRQDDDEDDSSTTMTDEDIEKEIEEFLREKEKANKEKKILPLKKKAN